MSIISLSISNSGIVSGLIVTVLINIYGVCLHYALRLGSGLCDSDEIL